MGRKRKDGDPFGLTGTRLYFRHGQFHYVHRADGRWEAVGADVAKAKAKAALYNDGAGEYGTVHYWSGMFLVDCEARVKAGTMSQRTLDDYDGYAAADGPLMTNFGDMLPEQIEPNHVSGYLADNAAADPPRPVPANRERAYLSSMLSWLMRQPGATTLKINPCMRASGVVRNPEAKRERYVTHDEYRATYAAGNRAVRLAMELVYRSLQRPEVDVLAWTPANVRAKEGGKVLHFRQSKSQLLIDIALTGQLGALVADAIGPVPQLHQPILHRLDGTAYTYDGLSSMLKKAQRKAGVASFGYRDLKGKGATDMWLAGVPIEQIQLLCGHADKTTTERYIKARWRITAQPNAVQMA